MLKIFRKNQFLRSILLLPVALALNVNVLLDTNASRIAYHTLLDGVLADFHTTMPVLHWLIFSFMLFGGAVLLNRMVIINRLSNTITLFPGLFYLIIMSALPIFGAVTSIFISLLIFILFLSNMMYINARTGAANKIFNVGLYLGVMSLLFLPELLFVFLVIIGINVLTSVKKRVLLNLVNGILLPFYMTALILLFLGVSIKEFSDIYTSQFGFNNFTLQQSPSEWITFVFILLYLLIVLITYNNVISKKSIQTIRKINFITASVPIIILIYLVSGISSLHLLMLLTPVLAFYTSEGVLRFKNENNAELIFMLLIVLCIVMPFL